MTRLISGGASFASILAAIGASISFPKIRTRKMYAARPTKAQVSDIARWNAAVDAKNAAKLEKRARQKAAR